MADDEHEQTKPESGAQQAPDDPDVTELSSVRADDALLDALAGADPKVAGELGAAELNSLLMSWSREVDSEPMPELVDLDTAMATIREAKDAAVSNRRDRRRRMLVPVAAAAVVLGVAFGGASVAAKDAQPGDTLWGLTQVLYSEKAESVEASYDVKAEFRTAREALDSGNLAMARDALDKAEVSLREVNEEENHDGLQREHDDLREELNNGSSPDPEPPVVSSPSSSDPGSSTTTPEDSSSTKPSTPPSSSTSVPPSSETPTSSAEQSTTNSETSADDDTGSRDDPTSGDEFSGQSFDDDDGASPQP